MPIPFHRARCTPARVRPFADLSCAAALALGAACAPAQSAELGRVEVDGHVVEAAARYDVLSSCAQAESLLQQELTSTWWRERDYGTIDVRFVVTGGKVTAVNTRSGLSFRAMRDVRRAVGRLECSDGQDGTHLYRMSIVFAAPDHGLDTAPDADPRRVALVEMQ